MSEHDDEDPAARLVRAAIPGRSSNMASRGAVRADLMFAPGRAALEASILLSAMAILVPLCALGAVPFAAMAFRAGNRRGLAALLAAIWCATLGVGARAVLGLGIAP